MSTVKDVSTFSKKKGLGDNHRPQGRMPLMYRYTENTDDS